MKKKLTKYILRLLSRERVRKVMSRILSCTEPATGNCPKRNAPPSPFKLRHHVIKFLTFEIEFRRCSFVSPTMTTILSLHTTLFLLAAFRIPGG